MAAKLNRTVVAFCNGFFIAFLIIGSQLFFFFHAPEAKAVAELGELSSIDNTRAVHGSYHPDQINCENYPVF